MHCLSNRTNGDGLGINRRLSVKSYYHKLLVREELASLYLSIWLGHQKGMFFVLVDSKRSDLNSETRTRITYVSWFFMYNTSCKDIDHRRLHYMWHISYEGRFWNGSATMEDVRHSEGGNIKLCFQKKGEKTKVWDVAPLALMSFL